MKLIILLLLPFTLLAKIDTVYIQTISDDNAFIEELIDKTNEVFGPYEIVYLRSDKEIKNHINITLTIYDCEHFIDYDEDGEIEDTYAGTTSWNNIDLCKYTSSPVNIFVHEIGHTLGLDHHYFIDSKMIEIDRRYLMHYIVYTTKLHPKHIEYLNTEKAAFFERQTKDDNYFILEMETKENEKRLNNEYLQYLEFKKNN